MFSVLSNPRNSNLYLTVALAITLVVILAIAVVPSRVASGPAFIPVMGSENPYFEYLLGEKAIFANPVGSNNALSAYHLGEKVLYANVVDTSNALSTYHLGEKNVAHTLESTLLTYRKGEKDIH